MKSLRKPRPLSDQQPDSPVTGKIRKPREPFRRIRDAAGFYMENLIREAEIQEQQGARSPRVYKTHPVKRPLGTSDCGLTPMPNPVREMQEKLEAAVAAGAFDHAARHWPNGTPCPSHRTEAIFEGHIKPGDHIPEYYQEASARRKALPEGPGGPPSWKAA